MCLSIHSAPPTSVLWDSFARGEGVGQDTLLLRGLIGVAPLWCTWPKQLNSGPRLLVCQYNTSDKAANWAAHSIMWSDM